MLRAQQHSLFLQLTCFDMTLNRDASNSPQIWGLVAGDNSALTKPQFYSTLRLISLAQASIMRLLMGLKAIAVSPLSIHKQVTRMTYLCWFTY